MANAHPNTRHLLIPGQVFGLLTVVGKAEGLPKNQYYCRCACGKVKPLYARDLMRPDGHGTKSCGGCLPPSRTTHGHAGKRRLAEHRIWAGLIGRCCNPKNWAYEYYGGRGITICDLWRYSFPAFLADVGLRPDPKLTIERIDNEKGYEPGNVRWATRADQMRNTRRTKLLTISGETHCLTDWAAIVGISLKAFKSRLRSWPIDRLLSPPCLMAVQNRLGR